MSLRVWWGRLKCIGADSSLLFCIPRLCSPKRSLRVCPVGPMYCEGRIVSVFGRQGLGGSSDQSDAVVAVFLSIYLCNLSNPPLLLDVSVLQPSCLLQYLPTYLLLYVLKHVRTRLTILTGSKN